MADQYSADQAQAAIDLLRIIVLMLNDLKSFRERFTDLLQVTVQRLDLGEPANVELVIKFHERLGVVLKAHDDEFLTRLNGMSEPADLQDVVTWRDTAFKEVEESLWKSALAKCLVAAGSERLDRALEDHLLLGNIGLNEEEAEKVVERLKRCKEELDDETGEGEGEGEKELDEEIGKSGSEGGIGLGEKVQDESESESETE